MHALHGAYKCQKTLTKNLKYASSLIGQLTCCGTEDDSSKIFTRGSIVVVCCYALERVTFVNHILADDKNSSLCDGPTDQVCPLIRRFWVAFC